MRLTYMDKQDNSVAGLHPYQTLTIPLKHRTRLEIYTKVTVDRRSDLGELLISLIINRSTL